MQPMGSVLRVQVEQFERPTLEQSTLLQEKRKREFSLDGMTCTGAPVQFSSKSKAQDWSNPILPEA